MKAWNEGQGVARKRGRGDRKPSPKTLSLRMWADGKTNPNPWKNRGRKVKGNNGFSEKEKTKENLTSGKG